jgi:FkbM family methyltransferase
MGLQWHRYMKFLRICRGILERLLGARIYGAPSTIMHIIPEKKRRKAWFSYQSIVRSILEEYQVDLVLDVGANIGQFALGMRRLYKGPIISFEPVSHTFAALKKIAPDDKNWLKFNYALGNESGEQQMNVYEMDQLSSLLETSEDTIKRFGEGAARPVKELVQMRRLDDIVKEMPFDIYSRKIFLKMDTQGYDLEVFKGARSIWENIVVIQAEVYQKPIYDKAPPWTDSISEYTKAGFSFAGLYPIVREGLYYTSSDCLMVR